MLLQFKTSLCAYVMACKYGYALDKILKFSFCFLFCELKLFHNSLYRQKVAGDIISLNLLVASMLVYTYFPLILICNMTTFRK